VVFIGVTGSCGKTTTKELIAAVLSSRFQGRQSHGNGNLLPGIAKTILNVRPWDDFCVVEIAAAVGGNRIPLERPLRLVQPQIGVVTNIGTDHLKVFRTMEATAAEKGKLIAALPSHGTAILNADDAHVLAMHTRCAGQVVTYGLAPDAMVRAENIRSSWPERLSFTVLYDGQSRIVYTQLCGAHWVSCVLAAIAVGLAMGVPLDEAVRAIQTVPPFKRRMSPVSHSNGATFIQDDFKAPLWSIAPTLAFMKEARARRKIVVLGTISDYQGDPDRIYASVARQALDVADNVVFIGPHARKALRGRRHSQNETLRAFYCVEAAWDYLQDLWQPGDLVLLKDSDQEHLDTLLSERTSGDERPLSPHDHSGVFPMPTGEDTYATAVVGLGNPGKRSQSTPHNVGQRVLDRIAQSLGGEWTRQEQALVARIEWRGIPVYFVKPLTTVNATGLMLVRLIQQLGIGLTDCVLVHDDADLSLGTVRVRMRSSDGGHRGVRSVFKAFRTDDLRRVKVGVGRPAQQGQLDDHVMTAFSSVELPIIDQACAEAADRVLELVGGHSNRVRVTDG
jgi:aminoacyl-tRNA hydrolase